MGPSSWCPASPPHPLLLPTCSSFCTPVRGVPALGFPPPLRSGLRAPPQSVLLARLLLPITPSARASPAGSWGSVPGAQAPLGRGDPTLTLRVPLSTARATLEILIPDFVKQTSEEKPKDSEELEVRVVSPPWCQAVLGFNRPGAGCSVSCTSSKRPACRCASRGNVLVGDFCHCVLPWVVRNRG